MTGQNTPIHGYLPHEMKVKKAATYSMKDRSRKPAVGPFITFLAKEFQARKNKNTSYSIRSFSKFLGIDQSLLSKVLKGQHELSQTSILKCLTALKVPEAEMANYLRSEFPSSKTTYSSIDEDVFSVISEWYHFAILELFKTTDFIFDIKLISERLNISIEETQLAINRLIKFEFLTLKKGQWALGKPNTYWSDCKTTSKAKKNLQKKLLEKSIVALETVEFEKRDHGSFTVAIDDRMLPEFKEKLQEFRRQMGDYFGKFGERNSVYQLTVSFFPLTKPETQQ